MIHLRPLPPPGLVQTLFGWSDPWAGLRKDFDRLADERPAGGYRLIMADWPWLFTLRSTRGEGKAPQRHYKTIPMDVIQALPVWKLAAPDALYLMWGTSPLLDQQLTTMRLHGFQYVQEAPWFKGSPASEGEPDDDQGDYNPAFAGGYIWRNCHEPMLIGKRGSPVLLPARRKERAAFFDPQREHSRKPDEQYRKAETLSPGPYLELFSRTDRPGWVSYGNQVGHFGVTSDDKKESQDQGQKKTRRRKKAARGG